MTARRYARLYQFDCELCECGHRSEEEAKEIHGATARIHAWLKARTVLVMNAEPVQPGAVFVRPAKLAKVPRGRLEADHGE
jgi:hypothetical protein